MQSSSQMEQQHNQSLQPSHMPMLTLCFSLLILLNSPAMAVCSNAFSRADFPSGFIFGSGTTAYQVEGAAEEDGRTPTIWDTFAHEGRVNGANGDIACDQYHKYKEDVKLMVETGLDAYRFSIAWSRLIPNGRGPLNPKGVAYYNHLINELISHGIQPHVLMYHVDTPQALEDEYGGWLSHKIVKDFTAYADVCFREFGDRVLYWTTINEANMFAIGGYHDGLIPPSRCSPPFGLFNCTKGNSSTEPYIVAHNILLAHASAANLYKKRYQKKQLGYIGINIYGMGYRPLTNSTEDALATQRANEFFHGWFVNPLVFGDYPNIMKKNVGARMPAFSEQESKRVKGSFDFIGINQYFSANVKNDPSSLDTDLRDFYADSGTNYTFIAGPGGIFGEIPIAPSDLQVVLQYFKEVYGNPPIYIHENGQRNRRNASLDDPERVKFLQSYIGALLESVRNGSNTRGYFEWSFLDVFELLNGYQSGYGLYYVDLDDPDLKRYPKLSAHWYSAFLKGGNVSLDDVTITEKNISSQAYFVH